VKRSWFQSLRGAVGLSLLVAAYLLASETLHLTRRNPFFVADVGASFVTVLAWYAAAAVLVGCIAGAALRTVRAQAFALSAFAYAIISLKIFWLDASLLAVPRIAGAFALFTAGWFTAAIAATRRLALPNVFPILLTVAYANVCLAIASGWALGGGRLLPFLLSGRTLAIVFGGALAVVGATQLQRVLERRSAWWWRTLVPGGVLVLLVGSTLALARGLPSNAPSGAGDATSKPDIVIASFDALRSDMLSTYVAEHPNSNFARVVHRSTVFENVVSHGPSTDVIVANNTFGGGPRTDCRASVPAALDSRGYFTAMLYAALGKRFEGSDCYEYYFSGDGDALLARFALTGLHRAIGNTHDALRHGALHAGELVEKLRLLARAPDPLYAYMHFLELHAPYLPQAKHGDAAFDREMRRFMEHCYVTACDPQDPSDAKLVAFARDAYVSLLDEADRALGDVLSVLEKRGRNYVLVVTADHGELLGERGGFAHGGGFAPELLDIPFAVMSSTSQDPQRRCELMLSSEAVKTTTLGAAGIPMTYPDRDELALTLRRIGRGRIVKRTSTVHFEIKPALMAQAGTWHNIHRERVGSLPYPIERCGVATESSSQRTRETSTFASPAPIVAPPETTR
jgi:hypothetical protein